MRKSTLFISAALTTFMLAVLFGVASAYQNAIKSTTGAATQSTAAELAQNTASLPTSAPTSATVLTPEQAATLAAQVLGRTDLYSVETADYKGTSANLVTFSSGDTVYVSPVGQILSINIVAVVVPTTVVSAGVASQPGVHHSNNGGVTFPKPQPQPTPGGGEGGGGGGGDD